MAEGDTRSLSYERPPPSPVPRWQFRLLFLLVLLNLAITIQLAYAPGIATTFKQWWAERQATREIQAMQRQAWAWTEPAGKVAWDENPETAEKLLAGPGYKAVQASHNLVVNYPMFANWPRSAAANPPAVAGQLLRSFPVSRNRAIPDDFGFVFFARAEKSTAQERLVYVIVEGQTGRSMMFPSGFHPAPQQRSMPRDEFKATAVKDLSRVAVACTRAQGVDHPRVLADDAAVLTVRPGATDDWQTAVEWHPPSGAKPATVRLEPRDQFRIYAGQTDPADASHFTIDYEFDGAKGTIHGRLKDDGVVELKPESGTIVGEFWDPRGR
jgi:hypothetical protein